MFCFEKLYKLAACIKLLYFLSLDYTVVEVLIEAWDLTDLLLDRFFFCDTRAHYHAEIWVSVVLGSVGAGDTVVFFFPHITHVYNLLIELAPIKHLGSIKGVL